MGRALEVEPFDVALSYAGEDARVANELSSRLQRAGIEAFDYRARPEQLGGRTLEESLESVYGAARSVVFLHSAHWSNEHTERELAAAKAGSAGADDLWVIRLDDSPLPMDMGARVWWDLERGLAEFVRVLGMRLGRRVGSRRTEGGIAVLLSALLGVAALGFGFRSIEREADILAWAGALLPAFWALLFRLLPDVVQASRRRGRRELAVESPVERLADRSSYLVAAVAVGGAILLGAVAMVGRAESLKARNALLTAISAVREAYPELRERMNAVSTMAARIAADYATFEFDAYDARLAEFTMGAKEFRDNLKHAPIGSTHEASLAATVLTDLERILHSHFGAQVEVLRNPKSSSSRARIASSSLASYNTFLGEKMSEFEEKVRAYEDAVGQAAEDKRWKWRGYDSRISSPPR